MVIEGTYTFPAPRERVLAALTEPEVLARVVPGCERIMQLGPAGQGGALTLELRLRTGPGPAVYTGAAEVIPRHAPDGVRAELRGRGPAGAVAATATLELTTEDDVTTGTYRWEIEERGLRADDLRALEAGAGAALAQQLCERLAAELRGPLGAGSVGAASNASPRGRLTAVLSGAAELAGEDEATALARQAIWMSAGLVVGLGALALTISLTRRLRSRHRE